MVKYGLEFELYPYLDSHVFNRAERELTSKIPIEFFKWLKWYTSYEYEGKRFQLRRAEEDVVKMDFYLADKYSGRITILSKRHLDHIELKAITETLKKVCNKYFEKGKYGVVYISDDYGQGVEPSYAAIDYDKSDFALKEI